MHGKIMEKEKRLSHHFSTHSPHSYQRFHKQQLIHKLHPAAKVCWYHFILFFDKQRDLFLVAKTPDIKTLRCVNL
jgi:hypothetical protein